MILNDEFVRSDADMEGVDFRPSSPLQFSLLGTPEVSQDFETGAPPLEFHLPIQHHRSWDHDQVRTPDALELCDVRKRMESSDMNPDMVSHGIQVHVHV